MTMSGFRSVWTTWGKCSFLPRSTLISHDCATCRRVFLGEGGFSLSLINWIDGADLTCISRFFHLSCSKMSASALRTLSWCHLHLPWLSAVLHPISMFVQWVLPHSPPVQVCWCWKSVIHWSSRKEMQKGSSSSGHVIFRFGRSHFVQASCDPSSTVLDLRISSSRCRSLAWTSSLFCLGSAFPIAGSGWFWVLVSPYRGSQWCPSTLACFLLSLNVLQWVDG